MYLNNGTQQESLPTLAYHLETPVEQYDLNYCFPLTALRTDGVLLEPLIPSLHARSLYEMISQPETSLIYRYLPYGPFNTLEDFCTWIESRIRSKLGSVLFVVTDLTRPADIQNVAARWVGFIGLLDSDAIHLSAEIGHVAIFPFAQRTHVTTHCCILLLHYLLNPQRPLSTIISTESTPSQRLLQAPGLGLRRAVWQANLFNEPSKRAAINLGFKLEGTFYYARVLPFHKDGISLPSSNEAATVDFGSPSQGLGRHSVQYAITWEEWRDGLRIKTARKLDRALGQRPVLESRPPS